MNDRGEAEPRRLDELRDGHPGSSIADTDDDIRHAEFEKARQLLAAENRRAGKAVARAPRIDIVEEASDLVAGEPGGIGDDHRLR